MTSEEELYQAKNLVNIAQEELEDAENNLKEVKLKHELPLLKVKHEGKFYKYNNAWDGNHKWFVYLQCVEVISLGNMIINSFEASPDWDDKLEYKFKLRVTDYLAHAQDEYEITKEEYVEAFKTFKEQFIEFENF
jgi:hypothetical protein